MDKAWVALIMGLLSIASLHFGWNLGLTEENVAAAIALLTPFVVWLVPNKTTTVATG